MNNVFAVAAIGALATLTACATPYQEMSFTGGVKATRIAADTAIITARGNAYTDPDTVQTYALRRAAEETLADGFDLFRIESDQDRTAVGSQSFGTASASRYAIIGTSFSMPIVKPGQTLVIRMTKGPKPQPTPDGLFDAHEVAQYMGATPYSQKRP